MPIKIFSEVPVLPDFFKKYAGTVIVKLKVSTIWPLCMFLYSLPPCSRIVMLNALNSCQETSDSYTKQVTVAWQTERRRKYFITYKQIIQQINDTYSNCHNDVNTRAAAVFG